MARTIQVGVALLALVLAVVAMLLAMVGLSPRLGTHIQASIQAASSPAGSDPGTATSVYMAYSPQKWITPNNTPMVQKSHPTKLAGRRLATTAPTVE